MAVTLTDSSLLDRCTMLSSYEGRNITDGSGESMYDSVHITDQDKDLVLYYINEAVNAVETELGYHLESVERVATTTGGDPDAYEFTFISEPYFTEPGQRRLGEVIETFAMSRWLEDKSESRGASYKLMYDNLMQALINSIRKNRPTLDSTY